MLASRRYGTKSPLTLSHMDTLVYPTLLTEYSLSLGRRPATNSMVSALYILQNTLLAFLR